MDKLIFDIGMHTGQDTAFYLAKGFRVIAVEANPLLVSDAEKHFKKEIDSGQLIILNLGIGDKVGTFPFYVNAKYSEWSSFDKEIGCREGGSKEVIDIKMVTFDSLLNKYGEPYFVKIDIEGNDFMVIDRLGHCNIRPKYLSVENGWAFMVEHLVSIGYTGFKFINQAQVQSMKCPSPSKEGDDISWDFPWGSSGPFGEDTPGKWKTAEEILIDVDNYWGNPNRDANIHGWYDLHAKFN